jgi:hypothetical protein
VDVNPDLGELLDVRLQPGAPHLLLHLPHLFISSVAIPGCLSRIRIFSIPDPGSA